MIALLALALAVPCPQQPDRPPNLVLLFADDLGWRDLGCTGSTFYHTPHLDALARRAVRFTAAYTASPVCSPTRASLLTGRSPARLRTTTWFGARPRRNRPLAPPEHRHSLDTGETTLAEVLKEHGYSTAFMGKWHLGGAGNHPEDQGFDVNIGGYRAGHPWRGYFAPWDNPKLLDGPDGTYLTDRLGDEAVAFVEHNRERPFFLMLSFYAVHTPLQGRPDRVAAARQRRKELDLPEPRWGREGERKVRRVQDHPQYAAMVEVMDENAGKVLAALDRLGLTDNTVVVFFSDNGGLSTSEGHPTSNLPLRAGKGWLYEGGIRVPLMFAGPGVGRPGVTCAVPAISMDLFPTVLELLGLPRRPDLHLDGTSLVPALAGHAMGSRPLLFHFPHYSNQGGRPGSALRLGRHKIVHHYEDDRVEVFDLAADVGELNDLSQARPGLAARLFAALVAERERVDALHPLRR